MTGVQTCALPISIVSVIIMPIAANCATSIGTACRTISLACWKNMGDQGRMGSGEIEIESIGQWRKNTETRNKIARSAAHETSPCRPDYPRLPDSWKTAKCRFLRRFRHSFRHFFITLSTFTSFMRLAVLTPCFPRILQKNHATYQNSDKVGRTMAAQEIEYAPRFFGHPESSRFD